MLDKATHTQLPKAPLADMMNVTMLLGKLSPAYLCPLSCRVSLVCDMRPGLLLCAGMFFPNFGLPPGSDPSALLRPGMGPLGPLDPSLLAMFQQQQQQPFMGLAQTAGRKHWCDFE